MIGQTAQEQSVQHTSASLAKLFHRASSSAYRAARILAKLPNPLHEVHSNQGLVSELMREEIIYEEAIRKERTQIARELENSSGNGRRDKRGPEHDSWPALMILAVQTWCRLFPRFTKKLVFSLKSIFALLFDRQQPLLPSIAREIYRIGREARGQRFSNPIVV
jgi:hypothetical protein